MRSLKLVLVGTLLLTPAIGRTEQTTTSGHTRRQILNFEKDTIQGDLTRPDGELTAARRKARLTPLMKARADFRDRIVRGQQ